MYMGRWWLLLAMKMKPVWLMKVTLNERGISVEIYSTASSPGWWLLLGIHSEDIKLLSDAFPSCYSGDPWARLCPQHPRVAAHFHHSPPDSLPTPLSLTAEDKPRSAPPKPGFHLWRSSLEERSGFSCGPIVPHDTDEFLAFVIDLGWEGSKRAFYQIPLHFSVSYRTHLCLIWCNQHVDHTSETQVCGYLGILWPWTLCWEGGWGCLGWREANWGTGHLSVWTCSEKKDSFRNCRWALVYSLVHWFVASSTGAGRLEPRGREGGQDCCSGVRCSLCYPEAELGLMGRPSGSQVQLNTRRSFGK